MFKGNALCSFLLIKITIEPSKIHEVPIMRLHKITLAILSTQLLNACGGSGDTSSNITPIPPTTV